MRGDEDMRSAGMVQSVQAVSGGPGLRPGP